jgi:formate hydrogenlyase subunit 4
MQASIFAALHVVLAICLAPLLTGIVNRTKAWFAGRDGRPLLQPYWDLAKLLRKGAVYSQTTTWIFRLAPIVSLAAGASALLVVPMGGASAAVSFTGDFVLLFYLLGLARFLVVLGALDTGSSFEGMGASREAAFSALAEPALFLGLITVGRRAGSFSLSQMYTAITPDLWSGAGPEFALVAVALAVVLLAENARIPFDDPNTHLELTMIHEVMVLDHSGPDLAAILYGSALKLWVFAALVVGIAVPVRTGIAWLDTIDFLIGMVVVAVAIGVVESTMARLRLRRIPQLLIGAGGLAAIAFVLTVR